MCAMTWCLRHGEPWHEGLSCEEHDAQQVLPHARQAQLAAEAARRAAADAPPAAQAATAAEAAARTAAGAVQTAQEAARRRDGPGVAAALDQAVRAAQAADAALERAAEIAGAEQERRAAAERAAQRALTMGPMRVKGDGFDAQTCPCPGPQGRACGVYIDREDGCNKMHCSACNGSFCWLCRAVIGGYDHFDDCKSPCYKKLFEGCKGHD